MNNLENKNILISKCILGVNCRYDCSSKEDKKLIYRLLESDYRLIPVCPEELGGLPTPRLPSYFVESINSKRKLKNVNGEDVTSYFTNGARKTLMIARIVNPIFIVFKDKSPSCGVDYIFLKDTLVEGEGITTEILRRENFNVVSSKKISKIL